MKPVRPTAAPPKRVVEENGEGSSTTDDVPTSARRAVEVITPVVPRVLNIDSFYSKHSPMLDEAIVIETAQSYGIEPEALMAFAQIESPKGPYMPDGRPYILYEAHVFARNCKPKGKYNDDYPTLSTDRWDSALYGVGGDHQYRRLERAMGLDQHAALCACSWGAYQILGENYKMLGFDSPEEMVLYMVESEANQFECFIRFLNRAGIIPALRAKDWDTAFYKYNGSGFKKHGYDTRFLSIYRDLNSHTLRRGSSGIKVVRLQKLLNKFDFGLKIDGVFGPATEQAIKELQQKWGIVVDGIVGAQTYERLASERISDTSIIGSKRVIGAGGAVVAGGAAVNEGINSINRGVEAQNAEDLLKHLQTVEQVSATTKRVVVSAKDAARELVEVQKQSSGAFFEIGFIIIAIAAYIFWTKWIDKKKAEGVK